MSTFKVTYTTINAVVHHSNAHSLDIATVYGFNVVAGRDQYKPGDAAYFIPIDSVLNPTLEAILFPPEIKDAEGKVIQVGSKLRLTHRRIKQTRIRGFASQGLLIGQDTVDKYTTMIGASKIVPVLEQDYALALDVEKYEPPAPNYQVASPGKLRDKPLENTLFHKYNGLENIKWFPDLFKEGEEVVIQEKLHGTNARYGVLPAKTPTLVDLKRLYTNYTALLKQGPGFRMQNTRITVMAALSMVKRKALGVFGLLPKYEHCYGSNMVELTHRSGFTGYYGTNVYETVFAKEQADVKVRPGETIYGEIIGEGIQKGYSYGCKEHTFVLFDVKVLQDDGTFKWLNPEEVELYAADRGFKFVPVLYTGAFDKATAYALTQGNSAFCPQQKEREGIVIKSAKGYNDINCATNKRALKWISEDYLSRNQTDYH